MLNRVELIGTLGRDPEVKHTQSGNVVANISLATTETYKDKQGKKVENTAWHNVQVWGKTAEIAEKYLSKGSRVYIEAKLNYRNYEKDGSKVYVTEIVGQRLVMLSSTKKAEATTSKSHADEEDDLPDFLK
jgi:single-strand DNA-binding protein